MDLGLDMVGYLISPSRAFSLTFFFLIRCSLACSEKILVLGVCFSILKSRLYSLVKQNGEWSRPKIWVAKRRFLQEDQKRKSCIFLLFSFLAKATWEDDELWPPNITTLRTTFTTTKSPVELCRLLRAALALRHLSLFPYSPPRLSAIPPITQLSYFSMGSKVARVFISQLPFDLSL